MAVIRFIGFTYDFEPASTFYASDPGNASSPTSWTWATSDANFSGSGFAFDVNGVPTAGTVSSFALALPNSLHLENATLQITNLSVDLALLAPMVNGGLTAEEQTNLLWRTLLSGDDDIKLPNILLVETEYETHYATEYSFAGDGRDLDVSEAIFAGDDKISADETNKLIRGDFRNVLTGSSLHGGDDVLTAPLSIVSGDADTAAGFVSGGDDLIRGGTVTGDIFTLLAGGTLIGGNDTIELSTGNLCGDASSIAGNAIGGKDIIGGSNASQWLFGDVRYVEAGGSLQGGTDTIRGGGGADFIYGDWESVDPGGQATGAGDVLYGEAGADELYGNGGNDFLDGGSGADLLNGGDGNDIYVLGSEASGVDTVVDSGGSQDSIRTLISRSLMQYLQIEYLKLLGTDDIDGRGNGFDNHIDGNSGDNLIMGGAGVDILRGNEGDDRLLGQGGTDFIIGGRGKDLLVGGLGRDFFDFNFVRESAAGLNRDVIQDFQRGTNVTGDEIDLRDIDADTTLVGNQDFTFRWTKAFSETAGELRYIDLGTTCLVQGDINGDGKADFEILVKVGTLLVGDFML